MHHRVDTARAQQSRHDGGVADIADDEFGADDGFGYAGAQIVQNHDLLACLEELQNDVAADIARAASDQNGPAGFH